MPAAGRQKETERTQYLAMVFESARFESEEGVSCKTSEQGWLSRYVVVVTLSKSLTLLLAIAFSDRMLQL